MRTATSDAGSPNAKRTAVTCWNASLRVRKRPRTVPSAQRPAAPSARSAGSMPCSETSNGLGNAISHVPARPATRKRPKRGRGRSPRIGGGEQHDDERLDLLQDDRRHRVSAHERLREEDRRERRRSRADDDARRDVARARAPQRGKRGDDHREQDRDEHDVLSEDDRRGLRRLREWTAQQRVGPPQPRRDGDGNDADGRRSRCPERRDHAGELRGARDPRPDTIPIRAPCRVRSAEACKASYTSRSGRQQRAGFARRLDRLAISCRCSAAECALDPDERGGARRCVPVLC